MRLPITTIRLFLALACAASTITIASPPSPAAIIGVHLSGNRFGLRTADLLSKANPKGEGVLVYAPRARTEPRLLVWLVIDGKGFALNGQAKDATPALPWPRDAPPALWKRTGLDAFNAKDALGIVFGS